MSGLTRPLAHQDLLIYTGPMTTSAAPDLAQAAPLFHALSDETRLAVLDMLRGGERCVCELQDALDAAQSRRRAQSSTCAREAMLTVWLFAS